MKPGAVTVVPACGSVLPDVLYGAGSQPNELDLRRIVRRLEARVRYRYVAPQVQACAGGYRIASPCCSRNVDAAGGVIDIARIVYDEGARRWQLYYKNHADDTWQFFTDTEQLDQLMDSLNEDPLRVFWQ